MYQNLFSEAGGLGTTALSSHNPASLGMLISINFISFPWTSPFWKARVAVED